MRIVADVDQCICSGNCVDVAPSLFAQRESDGKVHLLAESVPPADEDLAADAADVCPVAAISLLSDEQD